LNVIAPVVNEEMLLFVTGFAEPVKTMAVPVVGAVPPSQLVASSQLPLVAPFQVWANACGADIAKSTNMKDAVRETRIIGEDLAFIVFFEMFWGF
jgi:hypothetical protein